MAFDAIDSTKILPFVHQEVSTILSVFWDDVAKNICLLLLDPSECGYYGLGHRDMNVYAFF